MNGLGLYPVYSFKNQPDENKSLFHPAKGSSPADPEVKAKLGKWEGIKNFFRKVSAIFHSIIGREITKENTQKIPVSMSVLSLDEIQAELDRIESNLKEAEAKFKYHTRVAETHNMAKDTIKSVKNDVIKLKEKQQVFLYYQNMLQSPKSGLT